jgi:hypothetical protein
VAAITCAIALTSSAAPTLVTPTPANWKCKPFQNAGLVVAFTRKTLVYNGFHPNIQFTCNAGIIRLVGIMDGEEYLGAVDKLGPHRISIGIVEHPASPPGRSLYTDTSNFTVPFVA